MNQGKRSEIERTEKSILITHEIFESFAHPFAA